MRSTLWVLTFLCSLHSLPVMAQATAESLEGSAWRLTELTSTSLLDGVTLTLGFEGGNVAGSDGCNRFRGSYTIEDGKLGFGPLASTMMACPEPVMNQASAFVAGLERVRSARLDDDTLVLVDEDGRSVARFAPQSQTLADTRWTVTGYNNGRQAVVSTALETSLTLEFDAGGVVSGTAGCNTYRGGYSVEGDEFSVGAVAVTRRLCADPIMAQETAFLQALERSDSHRIEGQRLELRNSEGALQIVASRADQP